MIDTADIRRRRRQAASFLDERAFRGPANPDILPGRADAGT
jgi:hypothetical protein